MVIGLAGALAAAILYGFSTILQARAARAQRRVEGLDVRLLLRLTQSWPFLLSIGLDLLGFLLSLAALRSLPLFAVQAIVCANVAVTAVLAVFLLGIRLGRAEWLAVAAVSSGLLLLGLSARAQPATPIADDGRWALVASVTALVVAGAVVARAPDRSGAFGLGLVAGLCFGAADVSARVLRHPGSLAGLLGDPATLALVGGGILGTLLTLTALQRGRVTVVIAANISAYTLVPAIVGVALLGDHWRHGHGAVACSSAVTRSGSV